MVNKYIRSSVAGALVGLMLGIVSIVGCGGAPEEQGDASDIGQTEQPISAPRTASYVLGTAEGNSRIKCTPANAGQVCDVPTTRVMKFCLDNLNAEETADAPGYLRNAGDSSNHFTWTQNPATGAACQSAYNSGAVNVLVNMVSGVCPAGTSNTENFVCVNPTVVTPQLAENPSVPGAFFGMNGGIIHIDRTKLLSSFPNNVDRSAARGHSITRMGLALEGIGGRSDANATFLYSRRAILPLNLGLGFTLTTGENCILANYSSVLSPGIYAQDSVSCSTD